jgi:hypothetical protein
MRSKQYFTSIKNNPHEISTDPFFITIYQITQSSKEVKKNKKRYTFYFQYISFSEEPKAGLEPATYSLRMSYSTN